MRKLFIDGLPWLPDCGFTPVIYGLSALLLILLASCAPQSISNPTATSQPLVLLPSATLNVAPTQLPSATTLPPTATPTSTLTPQPTVTPTPGPQLCSPLAEVTLAELPGLVAGNTYQTPMPGRDSGHPGVDFAFYSHGARKTILGLPVQAAMAGRVAAVIPDRYPYGNAVILEIPLAAIPQSWLDNLNWPTPAAGSDPDPRLTCPSPLALPAWDLNQRSLYLMYGHLNQPSPLHVGDRVACGQGIGEVGTTGASVNPHLHFEARLGPAGAAIASMGHYDTHTTSEERNNYCVWRVSGWFQVVDPLSILAQQP